MYLTLAIVAVVAILLTILYLKLFGGDPETPRALRPEEQGIIDNALEALGLKNAEDMGKHAYAEWYKNKKYGDPAIIGAVIFGALLLFIGYGAIKGVYPDFLVSKPTPIVVLMPDPNNPSQYIQATYIPPTPTTIPVMLETQPAQPINQNLAVVPSQYFSAWVKLNGVYGKAGAWGAVGQESVGLYLVVVDNAACGTPVQFDQYTNMLALVETNSSVYGAEITSDGNSVTVMCEGTVDFVIVP